VHGVRGLRECHTHPVLRYCFDKFDEIIFMTLIVEITDNDPETRNLIRHLKKMARENSSINLLTESQLQAKEDAALAKLINEGRKSGRADKAKIFKRFGVKQ
jgi:hypothetical protein